MSKTNAKKKKRRRCDKGGEPAEHTSLEQVEGREIEEGQKFQY